MTTAAPQIQSSVLVVEDEEMLREFVCEALGMLGYRILSAPNGQMALEIWSWIANTSLSSLS